MKYFSGLLFLAVMAYLASPYLHLYQLHEAIANNDHVALEKLVDIQAIREEHKENLEWKANYTLSDQNDIFSGIVREGAKALGDAAVDKIINVNRILAYLRQFEGPLWDQVTFAFFESPTRFTIRLGQLGHYPTHVQMTLQDWNWRITAIYD